MATPEQAIFKIIGFRSENKNIRWYSGIAFEALAKLDYLIHHTIYEGDPLPSKGPVLLIGNHTSLWDTVEAYRLGQKSGRIIRAFARDTLLNPTIKEHEQVLHRTGHKKDFINSAPLAIRRFIGAMIAGFDASPLPRHANLASVRDLKIRAKGKFEQDLAVAMFAMETRDKEGKLVDPKPGAAWLAKDNPRIPIMLMGISKGSHRIIRTRLYPCYEEIMLNCNDGDIAKTNFTVYLMDKIAGLVKPEIRQDWYENRRPLALNRKKSS